ncbi:MAG: ABC transporter substrate-binding protein [Gemmobacter sp.]|nr:ABC transporter substrate-binding protein [Gemmobacter sp.]
MAIKAVDEGARIILGPVYAQEANAAGVAVAGRGVNVLSFSNNPDIAGRNVFVLGPTFQNTADRLGQLCRAQQGRARIMVVHDQTTWPGEVGPCLRCERGVAPRGRHDRGCAKPMSSSQNGIATAVPGDRGCARNQRGAGAVPDRRQRRAPCR